MKKVLFFTQNRWAFGSIHHALCKELYKHGIYANLLCEDTFYNSDEFNFLNKTYDLIITNPDKVLLLHEKSNIPLNKISAVAHGQWDILLTTGKRDFYSELHSFAVISNVLKNKCLEWNISRQPNVVELGLHFDLFYSQPSESLLYVGYGGAKQTYNFFSQEIKRGQLVEKACENLGDIKLKTSGSLNYMCMPAYYKTVDAVVMSSLEEGGGLPMMEAAAAGRLVLGTPVGYFEENAPKGGGIVLPLDETSFINELRMNLLFYKENPTIYRNKCLEIQNYARENYDWSKKIKPWVELILS